MKKTVHFGERSYGRIVTLCDAKKDRLFYANGIVVKNAEKVTCSGCLKSLAKT